MSMHGDKAGQHESGAEGGGKGGGGGGRTTLGCATEAASRDSRAPSTTRASPSILCSTTLIATSTPCHRPAPPPALGP